MLSSSGPDCPAKALPERSSSSSGGSPSTSQSAGWGRPGRPKTGARRPLQSWQAWQLVTAWSRAGASSSAGTTLSPPTRAKLVPVSVSNWAVGLDLIACIAIFSIAISVVRGSISRLGAGRLGASATVWGNQTRTPISCNMARWRSSRARLIVLFSQSQAHDDRVFTLAVPALVVLGAPAHLNKTLRLVNPQRPGVAHAHLKPQGFGGLPARPQT